MLDETEVWQVTPKQAADMVLYQTWRCFTICLALAFHSLSSLPIDSDISKENEDRSLIAMIRGIDEERLGGKAICKWARDCVLDLSRVELVGRVLLKLIF